MFLTSIFCSLNFSSILFSILFNITFLPCLIVFAILYFTDFKRTKLTEENIDEVMEEAEDKLDENERAYLAYSVMYYVFTDGLSNLDDEDAAYQNIYDKTIQDLINEAKISGENVDLKDWGLLPMYMPKKLAAQIAKTLLSKC